MSVSVDRVILTSVRLCRPVAHAEKTASVGSRLLGHQCRAALVGREDGWLKPLVVAALINGGLTLTGIGGLVSFAVGAAGFGALLRDWQG